MPATTIPMIACRTSTSAEKVAPSTSQRINALDLIRGFAVLGILLMNVQSFAMPDAAYYNPLAFGDASGLNELAFALTHLFVNQKFNAIFALLFGASLCLFLRTATAAPERALSLHYRRMFWLMLFGLAHFYLLWWGDILMFYAIGGCIAVLFRNWPLRRLFVASLLFLLLGALEDTDYIAALFEPDIAADFAEQWLPPAKNIENEIALFLGPWVDQVYERELLLEDIFSLGAATPLLLLVASARYTGLMLLGICLFRSGLLHAQAPTATYTRLAAATLIPGLALTAANLTINIDREFSADYNLIWGRTIDYWASVFMAVGYVALLLIWVRSHQAPRLQARLQAAGRLAFTNYLSQSLIGTTLFYGFGLGWFGQAERAPQQALALAIIALQLWWSSALLKVWRFGPLEWAWRCLTYWHWQPLLKTPSEPPQH